MSYKVKLDIFEGPFDLLVYLIEHSRMSIYDIKVSEITTQYMDYIQKLKAADVAVAQEFMVLAAELIELKSRMLLPKRPAEDAEEDAEDPRKSLVERLLEYKQFKEMAAFFGDQQELTEHIHTKPKEDMSAYEEDPEEILKTGKEQLKNAFLSFLFKKQKLEEMHRVYQRIERQKISLETRISEIGDMLKKAKRLNFSELCGSDKSVMGRVVTFMALLELLKEKKITAVQEKLFSDITVSLTEES